MGTSYYPDPPEFTAHRPVFHQRWRVVMHATDGEDAKQKADQLKELGLPCNIEIFVAVTDGKANDNRGEVVIQREFCGVAFVPAEPEGVGNGER